MNRLQRLSNIGVFVPLFISSHVLAQGDDQAADATEMPSPLDFRAGIGAFSRHLHYTDTATDLLVDAPNDVHDDVVDVALAGTVAAHWYPLAHFMGGPLAHLGITLGFDRSLKQVTDYDFSGTEEGYGHFYQRYYAGLRGRLPIDWFTLGLEATYGYQSVWVRTQSAAGDPQAFPDVTYGLVEGRLDGEARINRVLLAGYAGFAWALSTGEIGEQPYFEDAKAYAITFGGHVGYQVHAMFDVLAGVDAQSFRLNFNPVPVDNPRIAGGASDRYMTFWLGLRFVLPGEAGAAKGAAAGGAQPKADMDDFDSFD